MKTKLLRLNSSAFSLIEVTIAIAIAAFAVVSILAIIPTAMKSSADSVDQTAIGNMFEDIEDRIKGNILKPGSVNGSPFFYDLRGSFVDVGVDAMPIGSITTDPFYRVEVKLIQPDSTSTDQANFEGALAVQVKIFWPIDEERNAIHANKPGSEITFLTGAQTGLGWTEVDGNFQPKIGH